MLSRGAALAVFGRGTNNALWWRHQTASGWSNWQSLGGILTSAPGTWGPWTSLGGAVMAGTGPGAGNGLFAIANPDRHILVFGRVGMEYGYTISAA